MTSLYSLAFLYKKVAPNGAVATFSLSVL